MSTQEMTLITHVPSQWHIVHSRLPREIHPSNLTCSMEVVVVARCSSWMEQCHLQSLFG